VQSSIGAERSVPLRPARGQEEVVLYYLQCAGLRALRKAQECTLKVQGGEMPVSALAPIGDAPKRLEPHYNAIGFSLWVGNPSPGRPRLSPVPVVPQWCLSWQSSRQGFPTCSRCQVQSHRFLPSNNALRNQPTVKNRERSRCSTTWRPQFSKPTESLWIWRPMVCRLIVPHGKADRDFIGTAAVTRW